MTIFLKAPERQNPPDGSWNRLNIMATHTPFDQCALLPTDQSHFVEVYKSTLRARWGGFGACLRSGACDGCEQKSARTTMQAFTPRVLVRLDPAQPGKAYAMNKPEGGWSSRAQVWTWPELLALDGWVVGENYEDQHSKGFWLVATKKRPRC